MKRKRTWLLLSCLALTVSLVILPGTFAQRGGRRGPIRADDERGAAVREKGGKAKAAKPQNKLARRAAALRQEAPLVPISVEAVAFAETRPVAELEPDKGPGTDVVDPNKVTVRDNEVLREPVPGVPGSPDGALQTSAPLGPLALAPAAVANFDGISNTDNATFGLGRVLPPDTNGDVGPNRYVQTVNDLVRIFQKNGTPVGNPFRMSTLFTALPAANVCRTTDDGDPIVLYDELADRWMISQFSTTANPNSHQCIAVSKTGDPAGQYYVYDFAMPNNKFNDYPHFGVYPDAYYMTDNQFNQAGTAFLGAGVFAFNRQKLIAGDPTANFIYFDLASNDGGMLPADADGLVPPPAGSPGYFAQFTANEFGDPADAMVVWEFKPNFTTPAGSTFTQRADSPVALAAFDPRAPSNNAVEQPAPGAGLDAIQDRLMNRIQYRNFGGYESLVISHTVNVGPSPATAAGHQAAVRYYELRRSLPGGNFTVPEQATFAPDANNRWMPSAAMDNQGNLAVGYSVSSTTVQPSIRYAGRLAGDPANTLAQGETTLIAGTGVQTHSSGRWGDYSSMNVDPTDDCTFWFTTEYYTAASQASSVAGWVTRVGSFKFPTCTAPAQGTITGTVTNCTTGLPVAGALVQISDGHSRLTDGAGNFSVNVPPGSYTVSATAAGFGSLTPASVTVTNGNTSNANFCLSGIPVVKTAGTTLTAESCTPADNALSPGETVTMSFGLKNTGTGNTTNLVATLQPTGGVTSPSGPQPYGALIAGGATVTQPFTFTVDPSTACGGVVTATLQLQDGATNLGTVSFPVTVGALGATATNTYASGNISTPIPDVASVDIPVNVVNTGSITDVNVKVRLNHTFDGDLIISLVHPDGTVIPLSNRRGGSGQNFGTGANNCAGTPTVFDDSAAGSITGGAAPFANSFKPESPLAALNGKGSAGTWKLRISDEAALDTGTVGCVQLEITRQKYVCCGANGPPLMEAAPPAVLLSESAAPANNAPDPEETVTMDFPLRNIGDGATTNLVATLLPTGGVAAPSGPQTYGVVQPTGVPSAKPFTFVARGNCGDFITATLHLQDGAADLGNVTYTIRLGTLTTTTSSFSNAAPISIPNGAPVTTSGPANPYPSVVNVAGVAGTISKVTVQLKLLNHTFPDDIDVLLVGPGGQKLLLVSDAGGTNDYVNANLTFDDAAPASLSDSGANPSGTYKPTNFGTGDTFAAPAPAGPYADPQLLSVFNGLSGTNVNGTWRLFVTDDVGGDAGNMNGGWTLNISTATPNCVSQACTINQPPDITTNCDTGSCGAAVTYGAPTYTGSCGVVTTSPASGSFFNVGMTPVAVTGTRADNSTTTISFNVNVVDNQDPTVAAPPGVSRNTGPGSTSCGVVITDAELGSPTASDNCSFNVTRTGVPAGNLFPVGTTTVNYTVTDASGRTASSAQTVTVADNTPPTATPPANIVASAPANSCSAVVNPGTASGSDNCAFSVAGVRSDAQPLNAPYPVGTTTINWTVTDASGNAASAAQTVKVNDVTPPTLGAVTATPNSLWPPNHEMVNVALGYTSGDSCPGSCAVSVTSNEPVNGTGDGDTAPDWAVLSPTLVQLRSERAGGGSGRVYTITVTCTDANGNSTSKATTVSVPHSQTK
jgi:subtilisin-like proprotein convertase family protein